MILREKRIIAELQMTQAAIESMAAVIMQRRRLHDLHARQHDHRQADQKKLLQLTEFWELWPGMHHGWQLHD